jgi:hypothetical protein
MTICQVSEKLKIGPIIAQIIITLTAESEPKEEPTTSEILEVSP